MVSCVCSEATAVFNAVTVEYGEKSIVAFSRVVTLVSKPLTELVTEVAVAKRVKSPTVLVKVSMFV